MPRLTIDLPESQFQTLNHEASMFGKSIEEYAKDRLMEGEPLISKEEALAKLNAEIMPSYERAKRGEYIETTMEDIIKEAKEKRGLT